MSGLSFSSMQSPATLCVLGSGGFGFLYLLIYLYMELFSAVGYVAN